MAELTRALPRLKIEMGLEDFEKGGMTPWFSFRALIPTRPLPAIRERPHKRTARLLVRPLAPADLDAFWALRRAGTQVYSRLRGRPDVSIDHSREQLARLNDDEQSHWYFGAFLQDTGELIGEGGLPDVRDRDMSASGWPEGKTDSFPYSSPCPEPFSSCCTTSPTRTVTSSGRSVFPLSSTLRPCPSPHLIIIRYTRPST